MKWQCTAIYMKNRRFLTWLIRCAAKQEDQQALPCKTVKKYTPIEGIKTSAENIVREVESIKNSIDKVSEGGEFDIRFNIGEGNIAENYYLS